MLDFPSFANVNFVYLPCDAEQVVCGGFFLAAEDKNWSVQWDWPKHQNQNSGVKEANWLCRDGWHISVGSLLWGDHSYYRVI